MKASELHSLSDLLEQQVATFATALATIENKYKQATADLSRKEDDTAYVNDKLVKAESTMHQLKAEFDHLKELELLRRHEVCRLEALVEAERLQFSLTEHRLQQLLAEEQLRAERLRLLREDALAQKEDAMQELASAYGDMEAMQATLADSAIYVRYLRRKVLELEVENSRHAALNTQHRSKETAAQAAAVQAGAFNLSNIRASIVHAVDEAYQCDEEERRKRLKQLQLRWHPDKNPVLTEVATEVTKIINEEISKRG